ncbi:MAG: bifunctional folylpolyglutamate synthase/dihydrofolate synthase [Bacteroidaceae bacterium]|nr:bifunctional folylpolyglutamate synthase/dihydrofolate synthase [Bacteroidaceae bacterium]
MTYKETTEYLFTSAPLFQNVGKEAYKEGLYNTEMLDEYFHHPHTKFKTIHVAGTNGKGSCSHTIASILQAAGYKVGLFTSPHLIDFRERIRVNSEMIPEQYVVDFVEQNREFFEPLHPSFFELTTAMAFKFFAEQNVDIAVIEVGLGGRLDCTNIIKPLISIITNISFDHVSFLGNTLAKIAGEKAGIIKTKIPVVIGEVVEETRPVFCNKAKDMSSPIYFAEEEQEVESYEYNAIGGLDYVTKTYGLFHSELGGEYQIKNTNTILCAIKYLNPLLDYRITEQNIRDGFNSVCENTGLMGRWQKVGIKPITVCDTGHNVGCFEHIVKQLSEVRRNLNKCGGKLFMVFGMVNDKDINGVLSMLPKDAEYFFTQASVKRAMPYDDIQKLAATYGLMGKAYPNVKDAYLAACDKSADNDFIYIGGSSFVVADFLTFIKSLKR